MPDLTCIEFIDYTLSWCKAKKNLPSYWSLKGGWEGWIQTELAAELLRLGDSYFTEREQLIFSTATGKKKQQKVDLLLNSNSPPVNKIPVEIKAQSLYNADDFIPGILKDLVKLSSYKLPDYSQCMCIMMAIAFSPADAESVITGYYPRRDPCSGPKPVFNVSPLFIDYTLFNGWQLEDNLFLMNAIFQPDYGWYPGSMVPGVLAQKYVQPTTPNSGATAARVPVPARAGRGAYFPTNTPTHPPVLRTPGPTPSPVLPHRSSPDLGSLPDNPLKQSWPIPVQVPGQVCVVRKGKSVTLLIDE